MNFLNNLDLIPKNFIVANMVEILKEDPENGVSKIFSMANTFIKDEDVKGIMGGINHYYNSHPSVKLYIKNMIYNTNKASLNHCLQNIAVHSVWEGIPKRQKYSKQYGVNIPHAIVLRPISQDASVMSIKEINRLLSESRELGIHCVIINGGDPFTYKELLDVYEKNADMQFIVFTPGITMNNQISEKLSILGNVIPMFIIEGNKQELNHYQDGFFDTLMDNMMGLKSQGLLFGVVTPTGQNNLDVVLSDEFILNMIRKGCRFNAYVHTSQDKKENQLNASQLSLLEKKVDYIRQTKPYLTFQMMSLSPFIGRSVTGPYRIEFNINQNKYPYFLPELTNYNSQNKPLITVIREYNRINK
ncbi:MAG: radical SAM protein [Turicibacter sp.]